MNVVGGTILKNSIFGIDPPVKLLPEFFVRIFGLCDGRRAETKAPSEAELSIVCMALAHNRLHAINGSPALSPALRSGRRGLAAAVAYHEGAETARSADRAAIFAPNCTNPDHPALETP